MDGGELFSADVRCVWLGTFWSRSLLQKTRRASSRLNHESDDLCLTEELKPAFEEACRGAAYKRLPSNDCYIVGALALRPRERYQQKTSGNLGNAVRVQLSHWTVLAGRPLDNSALIFDVAEALELRTPAVWNTISGRKGGSFFTTLEDGQEARFRRELPAQHHPAFDSGCDQCDRVLRLPLPYAIMFMRKQWFTVAVPDLACKWNYDPYGTESGRKFVSGLVGAGRKYERAWPALRKFGPRPKDLPDAAGAGDCRGHGASLSKQGLDVVHDSKKVWDLADCLVSLGSGRGDCVDPSTWQDFVAGLWFQHCESLLLSARRHAYVAGEPSLAFRIGHLVETMLFAMFLSNDSNVGEALKMAACLLLPQSLATAWIDRISADPKKFLPSAAIMSQRRAALDIGFARLQQEWIKDKLLQGCCIFAMTDSSPQGGRDYEITVLDIVAAADARHYHARG